MKIILSPVLKNQTFVAINSLILM